jgi:hypothetical protein
MFFLDISQAISAYDNAAARSAFQQISEPLLNAFEVEVAGDLKSMAGAAEEINDTIKTSSNSTWAICSDAATPYRASRL